MGVADATRVAVALAVVVPGSAGGVVPVRLGVVVNSCTVEVAASVGVCGCLVGGGVLVPKSGVRTDTAAGVGVGGSRVGGIGVENRDSPGGVGVNRKTPGITGSSPSACPSSRRITCSTEGSMGAIFS